MPLNTIGFPAPSLQTSGVSLVNTYPWLLYRSAEAVAFEPGVLRLQLQRSVGAEGVTAGAVRRSTVFHPAASYKFRLRTAPGPLPVTAFVLTESATGATPILSLIHI